MINVNERHSPFLILFHAISLVIIYIYCYTFQLKYVFREGGGERVTCRDSKLTKRLRSDVFVWGGGAVGGGEEEGKRELRRENAAFLASDYTGREGMIAG